jgi:S1-C subfamily serine protease
MTGFRSARGRLLAALVACLLAGAGIGAGTYAAFGGGSSPSVDVAAPASPASPAARPAARTTAALTVGQIYRQASPGVVEVLATTSPSQTSPFPFGQGGSQQAQGSGFVYDAQGDVVTNEHVVSGAGSVSVRLASGATYKARVVGSDASTDLAVVRISAPRSLLHPLALADSSAVQVGDGVVAIGSPFGLENTVTSGIVSGLGREITAPNDFTIDGAIQTDAAINHGNSGGPLLDTSARVIGVTAQIKSESGGNEGVGFAIPSNTVRAVVPQLLSKGKVEHAYLGVQIETIPASVSKALGVPAGVEVTEVRPGTPAAKASLRGSTGTKVVAGLPYPTGGDVITKLGTTRVTSADQLRNLVDAKHPGDTVSITYVRGGAEHTVSLTLGTRPS